jgi:hypothetical protein
MELRHFEPKGEILPLKRQERFLVVPPRNDRPGSADGFMKPNDWLIAAERPGLGF